MTSFGADLEEILFRRKVEKKLNQNNEKSSKFIWTTSFLFLILVTLIFILTHSNWCFRIIIKVCSASKKILEDDSDECHMIYKCSRTSIFVGSSSVDLGLKKSLSEEYHLDRTSNSKDHLYFVIFMFFYDEILDPKWVFYMTKMSENFESISSISRLQYHKLTSSYFLWLFIWYNYSSP